MSQFQPYYQDDFDDPRGEEADEPYADDAPPPPPRISGMALASLICGVMFCLPAVPSLCATIFGVIGLRETRHRRVSGRGFAISGLILGIVGTAGWLLVLAAGYIGYNLYTTERNAATAVAKGFVQDLAGAKIDAAQGRCEKDADRDRLVAASEAMKKWGPFNSLDGDIRPPQRQRFDGSMVWDYEGVAVFSRGECTIFLRLRKDGTAYRVERFDWKPGN